MISAYLPDLFFCSPLSATKLNISPKKTILFLSQNLCACCGPCWELDPFCHLGFSLNVTVSVDFPDHLTTFCFMFCTPSWPLYSLFH